MPVWLARGLSREITQEYRESEGKQLLITARLSKAPAGDIMVIHFQKSQKTDRILIKYKVHNTRGNEESPFHIVRTVSVEITSTATTKRKNILISQFVRSSLSSAPPGNGLFDVFEHL